MVCAHRASYCTADQQLCTWGTDQGACLKKCPAVCRKMALGSTFIPQAVLIAQQGHVAREAHRRLHGGVVNAKHARLRQHLQSINVEGAPICMILLPGLLSSNTVGSNRVWQVPPQHCMLLVSSSVGPIITLSFCVLHTSWANMHMHTGLVDV